MAAAVPTDGQAACFVAIRSEHILNSGTTADSGLSLSTRTAGDITIAELAGELDVASAPVLREQLLGLLRPGSSQLVIDLSDVSFCDASGLAVLISTGRRARLLDGFMRLAAVSPQVERVLQITGLDRSLAIFPTVQAAAEPRAAERGGPGAARPDGADAAPATSHARPVLAPADAGELREAVAATAIRLCRAVLPAPRPASA
jgi:anti-anti-sigma factor